MFIYILLSKQTNSKEAISFTIFLQVSSDVFEFLLLCYKPFSDYFHRNVRINFDNKCDLRFITLKYLYFPILSTVHFLSLHYNSSLQFFSALHKCTSVLECLYITGKNAIPNHNSYDVPQFISI